MRSPGGYAGYKIATGEKNDAIRAKGAIFIDHYRSSIDRMVEEFGSLPTRDLELRATIIYADRDALRTDNPLTRQEFMNLVKKIKPRFDEVTIEEALSELEISGHVNPRSSKAA